jgi:hypothetical protein
LLLAGFLSVILAVIGTWHLKNEEGKDQDTDTGTDTHTHTCTPMISPSLDGLLVCVCVCSIVISVLVGFFPLFISRKIKRRGEGEGEEALLPPADEEETHHTHTHTHPHMLPSSPSSIEGGEGGERKKREGSRRVKLLLAYLCLSMFVTLGRASMSLFLKHRDKDTHTPPPSLLFIDVCVFSLLAPLLWCLYSLDKELFIFVVLRRWVGVVQRVCVGVAGNGKGAGGGEEEEM